MMKWITWEKVGIDRIACAWLLKKYIDKDATFEFIEYGSEIDEENGNYFDIPGCKYSHRRGRCTFYTLLKDFKLNDSVLKEVAKIIDGADSINEIVPSPESYGLEAICIGLQSYLNDDQLAIKQGEIIFESLYVYLKNKK